MWTYSDGEVLNTLGLGVVYVFDHGRDRAVVDVLVDQKAVHVLSEFPKHQPVHHAFQDHVEVQEFGGLELQTRETITTLLNKKYLV